MIFDEVTMTAAKRETTQQNYALVVDTDHVPHPPVHPAVARRLLRGGQAAILKRYPFTIILKTPGPGPLFVKPLRLKIDPGAKTTGLALLDGPRVIWAAELTHRGQRIKAGLDRRRSLRRGRRNRKTRYRPARFDNRTRPTGWLPPSLMHRVETTMTWMARLCRYAPVQALSVERVRFDMQLIRNPEIQGVTYQQGTLWQQEVRQYVFTRAGYRCVYCGAKDLRLELDHIVPRRRGSDAPSNLTAACRPCNQAKGDRNVVDFLKKRPEVLARLRAQIGTPLRDAAAVNATRWRLWEDLCASGHPVEAGTGGRTAWNRKRQDLAKEHWIDAACVGASTPERLVFATERPLQITCIGRGTRQVVRVDKYGFQRAKAGRIKRAYGFSTGDHVRLVQPRGKYAGTWSGTVAGIRERGDHDMKTHCGKTITSKWSNYRLLQRADGYAYA
jgi:5-methylcytosine-specific restriction endonuclease McrA